MNDIVNWLLEENTPEIRYRTLIELLEKPKEEIEVKEAYQKLLSSSIITMVMNKFDINQKWEDINAFLALEDFGLTRENVNIDDYVERAIKRLDKSMKCSKILFLRNLVELGYYEHPWVKKEIEKALENIRPDGTVHCLDMGKKRNDSRLPDMGCYRQTTTYLLLAAELKKKEIIFPQFQQLIDFYINHQVIFHKENESKVIIKEMTGTFYPIDHVHIGLPQIIYALSVLGAGGNEKCRAAWKLLEEYKNAEEKYLLTDSFDKPYIPVGEVGKENKWVTLYMLLAQKYRGNKT